MLLELPWKKITSKMSLLEQVFHSDYFSGWDDEMLQYLLDECENYSEVEYNNRYCPVG